MLVVDDSRFMQMQISGILERAGFEVIGQARNGLEAFRLNRIHQPDVITLDIMMPKMDGLEALELIMSDRPVPVVIVSSYSRIGGPQAIRALELGAVEILEKPSTGGISLDMDSISEELVNKVETAARVRVVRNLHIPPEMAEKRSKLLDELDKELVERSANPPVKESLGKRSELTKPVVKEPVAEPPVQRRNVSRSDDEVIRPKIVKAYKRPPCRHVPVTVIGGSTGAPGLLSQVLPRLKPGFKSIVLMVIHTPASFSRDLTVHLNQICDITVTEAQQGMTAKQGNIYLAPGDRHLRMEANRKLVLDDGPKINFHRPSVNTLFDSVAELSGPDTLGIVLTGMGQDGTDGAKSLHEAGGRIITQDSDSCVVYGMPKSVYDAGYSDQVVDVDDIVDAIQAWPSWFAEKRYKKESAK